MQLYDPEVGSHKARFPRQGRVVEEGPPPTTQRKSASLSRSMSYLVHIGQSPIGVARALGSRIWFGLPGVGGAMAAYSYFPTPTVPGKTQNIAGALSGGARSAHAACSCWTPRACTF
jgi:hypothetical protein